MAKRNFNYVFEDIRRNSTLVRPDGFADDGQVGDDVDVDTNAEDASKAVTRSRSTVTDDERTERAEKPRKPAKKDQQRDSRREVLAARRAGKEAAESSIATARAESAAEVGALRKEVAELKGRDDLANAETEYATKKADIEAQLAKAMEDGKHADYARLNSQLIELNNDLQRKRLEVKARTTTAPVEDLSGQRGNKAPLVRVQRFLKDNSDWWADPEHEDAVDYAKSLDQKLTRELGLDPNSDAYWEKFNKNFDKKFEGLRVRGDDEDDVDDDADDTRGRGNARVVTPPTKGAGGGGKQQRQQQQRANDETPTKVTLTAADKQNMRQFGLDPSNEEHLVEYARNKVPDEQE